RVHIDGDVEPVGHGGVRGQVRVDAHDHRPQVGPVHPVRRTVDALEVRLDVGGGGGHGELGTSAAGDLLARGRDDHPVAGDHVDRVLGGGDEQRPVGGLLTAGWGRGQQDPALGRQVVDQPTRDGGGELLR